MSRPCPKCGTPGVPEARFCRLCGTPLRGVDTNGISVNPRAQTMPLSDEGRTTRGFSKEDGGPSADTTRVKRAEMESLLRQQTQTEAAQKEGAPEADGSVETYAAPETSALYDERDGGQRALKDFSSSRTQAPTGTTSAGVQENKASSVAAVEPQAVKPRAKDTKAKRAAKSPWQFVAFALLFVAVVAAALAFYYSRGTGARNDNGAQPISISDQQRLVEEKLAEADRLMAAGNVSDAIARLRYAVKLDPRNARAHRMLAEALERTGAVNDAIDEYRAATENDPQDEETWLRYADALRRVGRTDEARDIYQRFSSSATEDVARRSKEELAKLPPSAAASGSNAEPPREGRSQNRTEEAVTNSAPSQAPAAAPPPPSTPSSAPSRNGAESGRPTRDPVASYDEAMRIIEGKNIKKMNRADLIKAYELLQYAQRGPHAAEATRHLNELDKELFERRKRGK